MTYLQNAPKDALAQNLSLQNPNAIQVDMQFVHDENNDDGLMEELTWRARCNRRRRRGNTIGKLKM